MIFWKAQRTMAKCLREYRYKYSKYYWNSNQFLDSIFSNSSRNDFPRKAKNRASHLCSLSVRAVQAALQGIERDARQPSWSALVRTLRRRRALPSQLSRALPALTKISWIFLPAYQLSSSVRECFAKRTFTFDNICKWFCLLAFTWRTVRQFWLQMTKSNLYWLLVKRMYWTNNFLQVIPHLGAQS